MSENEYRFPFGQRVLPRAPSADAQRGAFVLGAYPSALHVAWSSRDGSAAVAALPVDNEPAVFWDGADEEDCIEAWKATVGFDEEHDGTAVATSRLNGTSGVALDRDYLAPLQISRADAWLTDCLPTYRASIAVAKALDDRFNPAMSGSTRRPPLLPEHPSESAIIAEASARVDELRGEFTNAAPTTIVTLGNAAARVLQLIVEIDVGPVPLRKDDYGRPITVAGYTWYPLAHPGATRKGRGWFDAHDTWRRQR